jgi:hypothetical protein
MDSAEFFSLIQILCIEKAERVQNGNEGKHVNLDLSTSRRKNSRRMLLAEILRMDFFLVAWD